MRIKTENVEESLEPVDVDKAVFRSIKRRDRWSEQNVCGAWIQQSRFVQKCTYKYKRFR